MAGVAPKAPAGDSKYQDHSPLVSCTRSFVHALRSSVLESFASRLHGGAEVYGVLSGTHIADEVRVEEFRAVAFQSAMAGTIPLSPEERSAFAGAVARSEHRDERQGLGPVGWFRSHPHSELALTNRDLEIANTFFPAAHQVVMILRPSDTLPTLVRFFYRGSDAPLETGSAYTEFALPLTLETPPVTGFPTQETRAASPIETRAASPIETRAASPISNRVEAAHESSPPAAAPRDNVEFYFGEQESHPGRLRLLWLLVLAAVVALLTVVYWLPRPPETLALRVFDAAGQLRIMWEPVQKSEAGSLEIDDGGVRLSVELQPEQLRSGSFTYVRRTGNVNVRLVVLRRGGPLADEARYRGRDTAALEQNPAPTAGAAREAPKPAAAIRVPLTPAELLVPVLVAPPPAHLKFTPPAAAAVRPGKPSPDLAAPPAISGQRPPSVLPPVEPLKPPVERPAPPPTASSAAAAPHLNQSPAAAAPTPVAAPARAPLAPASGRIIWIGRLQKNQALVITGKTPSSGTLIGELPGKPLKFSVSPGNLASDGLVLYTANPLYANNVIESAGSQNGWNKTVYALNPKSATDVTVQEAPSLQNQWNRLVLQTKNPKIGVIVIDWTLVN
jgi:hypothetical protein